MHPFYREIELVKPVMDYFQTQGYRVKREIRIGFCRADIVAFRKEQVVAVELKLSNWKKALVQAKNYQLAADYVYLAFPLMKSYNVLRKCRYKIEKQGLGLLVLNEKNCKVSEIIKPRRSDRKICSIKLGWKQKKRKTKYKTRKTESVSFKSY